MLLCCFCNFEYPLYPAFELLPTIVVKRGYRCDWYNLAHLDRLNIGNHFLFSYTKITLFVLNLKMRNAYHSLISYNDLEYCIVMQWLMPSHFPLIRLRYVSFIKYHLSVLNEWLHLNLVILRFDVKVSSIPYSSFNFNDVLRL